MSHELRTPLNAIVGFAQLLEIDHRTPLTYTRKSYVGHIVESGAHLLELINEVLELDRIEAGKLALAIEDVTVRLVVDDCLVLLEALARRHGVVIVDCADGADSMVRISVEDTGIGIPEERRSEILERFGRPGQGTVPVEGTGIGLAVSKQFVDLMDGSIGFESALGAGSMFWFELPLAKRDSDAEPGPVLGEADARLTLGSRADGGLA